MTNNIFEGDPKLILGPDGSRLEYRGGQPVMDRGIENAVSIALGTKDSGENSHQKGWVGNFLMRSNDHKIGSDYQDTVETSPTTLGGLVDIEQAAERALTGQCFGKIDVTANNPDADRKIVSIIVSPKSGTFEFRTDTFSQLWRFQAKYPANERI